MTSNSNSYNYNKRRTVKAITVIFVFFTFSLFVRTSHLSLDEDLVSEDFDDDNTKENTTNTLEDQPLNLDYVKLESVWTYRCKKDVGCVRELLHKENETEKAEDPVELEICWLNCGENGPLWPYPTQKKTLGKCLVSFMVQNIAFTNGPKLSKKGLGLLQEMEDVFLKNLGKLIPSSLNSKSEEGLRTKSKSSNNTVLINIAVKNSDVHIDLDTSEVYSLKIFSGREDKEACPTDKQTKVEVTIKAETIFGARHALESLSQLMAYDRTLNCFKMVSNAEIEDGPEFPYRGVLLDTARNFIPIPDLKRLIDAMSYNKLNIFHWHLSDTNSFPFYSKRVPQMVQYGAYSEDKIYFPKDVKDFVQYARVRGIKIIPELDAPAHAGNGWQWGKKQGLGDLAVCINKEPWRQYCGQPPCGQLNPVNVNVYKILGKLYKDMLEVFDTDLFHMGGDEVYGACWEEDPVITGWISKGNTFDVYKIWGFFQSQAYKALQDASASVALLQKGNKSEKIPPIRPIVWTSGLTDSQPSRHEFLNPTDYIIQVWEMGNSPEISELLKENYQLIISNVDTMYLDHGAGTWLGKEHIYEYKLWQKYYDNKLSHYHPRLAEDKKRQPPSKRQILGAEATLWAEKVNEQNMDAKIWPRTAAMAENLWSDPKSRSKLVYSRLNFHNRRMIQLGIRADQLQPESCLQLTGSCEDSLNPI